MNRPQQPQQPSAVGAAGGLPLGRQHAAPAPAPAPAATQQGAPMKEFVLRMASASEKWNVARFNVPVDLGAWSKPLRTYRADEIKPPGEGESGPTPPPPPRPPMARRPFARPMYPRNVKNIPLHLDDTGDAHTYVGRINKAGESSNTFLLIQNGNEFKVVPAGDWYHFRAKRPFVPMGAEEAEEHMKQMEKQHGGSRWASAGRKGGGKGEDKEDGEFVDESRFTVFGESNADSDEEDKGAKGAKAGGGKKDKDEDVGEEKEDIDFEETWDDDEGGTIDEPQEEEKKKKERKTKDPTKQDMRKLIKGLAQLEGDEANIEDSEDEGSEDEHEEEEDKQAGKGAKKEDASSPKDASKAGGKRKKGSSPTATPTSAAKKPKLETPAKTSAAAAAAAAAAEKKAKEPLKLSEESVRQLLARKEQMTTVSVVNYFKAELAADPSKKPELTRIVKSIAKMVEIPPGSGKKFLVLKDK